MTQFIKEPEPRNGVVAGAFAVYLVLLAWIILWKLQVPYIGSGDLRTIKLVPYIAFGGDGASRPMEVAVNIILFIPFGAFLGVLAPSRRWWKHLAVLAGASLVFEITQYILAIGSSDTTDVIDNSLGGMIGFVLVVVARRRRGGDADRGARRILVIVTAFFALAVVLFLLSPIQFHSRRR